MATEPKFTPGPWTHYQGNLRSEFPTRINEIHAGLKHVVVAWPGFDSSNITERREVTANARLIAAAPDLYAALTDMLAGWRYIRDHHGDLPGVGWDRAEEAARAALIKVTP